jgi:hypothetical protein
VVEVDAGVAVVLVEAVVVAVAHGVHLESTVMLPLVPKLPTPLPKKISQHRLRISLNMLWISQSRMKVGVLRRMQMNRLQL